MGTNSQDSHTEKCCIQVEFEGEATDGGFALDDVTFYDGNCQSK